MLVFTRVVFSSWLTSFLSDSSSVALSLPRCGSIESMSLEALFPATGPGCGCVVVVVAIIDAQHYSLLSPKIVHASLCVLYVFPLHRNRL